MKLSIITINLNNREGLQKTIDSVICQTFRDFDWIVIDGGSSDGSRELIEQYSEHFVYWVSEPDKGIYNAMNKGIKVAKGEYLQFLNSGDWIYNETALERCFSHNFNADIVYGDLIFCHRELQERYYYPKQLSIRFLYHYSLGHSSSFIKRDIIQNEPYDEHLKIVSDWKFFLIQALKNRRFEHLEEIVSCFDTSGVSSVNEKSMAQERDRVIQECVPNALLTDLKYIDCIENQLNEKLIRQVRKYGKVKKNKRIITACLTLIEIIDTLTCSKKRSQS